MKKVYVIIMVLCFLGMAIIAAAADPVPNPRGQGQGWGQGHEHHGFLNLSKEQKEKMKEVGNRFYADTRDLRYELLQKKLEMKKLFGDPKVDDATLMAKQKELIGLKLKMMERKSQMKIEWRRILTPEQIQKLDRISMFRGMGGGHRGMHRGMDHGKGPGMGPMKG
jgi:Spy/CpxP family protein refolding chaperone